MSEVVNVVVALAVIVFVVRWATSTSRETPEERNVRTTLGFRPKAVTPEMTETISSMFPDMPRENIHYDLLRTGSVEMTTNKIIERGFLDPPPQAYFRLYPRTENARQPATGAAQRPASRAQTPNTSGAQASSSSSSAPAQKSAPSLIARYHLENYLSSQRVDERTKEREASEVKLVFESPEQAGGKARWEETPEKREASLRERKAQMILAARKRLIEQQKAAGAAPAEAGPSGLKTE
ncbi:uncharacterized protein FOMMEDRAFT_138029 [Fomitiporia mediterranea MF3/22]|uniref:uncharacterized protein n=1 Tax=Fomitiporia mediterranea (strain MF3/22) TaxID=694068 RepID=UPI0004409691|nr:uncharacterized protein FOMMEDRAFT_138029 [Fomitiporia mediterranea MF3/22]EJD07921.1 hypothetical protein FOMMEDRAFT_138029 [Fomitiporia mediterranea MF3/22]